MMDTHWRAKAEYYEAAQDEALNKIAELEVKLRDFTEPDAVITELRNQLENERHWWNELCAENRMLIERLREWGDDEFLANYAKYLQNVGSLAGQ